MATISTHNGPALGKKENSHTKNNEIFEVWKEEKLPKAYDRIFGNALIEFNAKQTRADKKINSYLIKIKNDEKKHTYYEMIVGIYGNIDRQVSKKILKEFVDTWQDRNPNFELIGAYYYAKDEEKPHVYIDYIPVAHGYKRGLSTQNGLTKALAEMGYETKSYHDTAQIQWIRVQNKELEEICNSYGIDVEHPDREKKKHLDIDIYKATKRLEELNEEINKAKQELSRLQEQITATKGST